MSGYVKTVGVVIIVSVATYVGAKIASASSKSPPKRPAAAISASGRAPMLPTASAKPSFQAPARPTASAVMTIEDDAWTGVLVGQSIDLSARLEAKVKTLSVRVGDTVRANDVLAELDTTTYQHEIAAAEASVRAARADSASAAVHIAQARDREGRLSGVARYGGMEIP